MGARRIASRVSTSATGFTLCEINHLGPCPEFLLEPEGARAAGELGHLAIGIGEIAEHNGAGGAGLRAGGDIFARLHLASLGEGPFPGLLEPVVAEGAFLHDAL